MRSPFFIAERNNMKPRNWLELAKNDIQFCEEMEKQLPQEYAKAGLCFHVQQAIEKLLRGILSANGRAPQCTDIYNLTEICEVFINADIPAGLLEISNTLTAWGKTFEVHEFDKDTYDKAKALIAPLTEILHNEINRTETMTDKLEYAIVREYAKKYREWQSMSREELIEKSDIISATRFVRDNISDSFTDEEAEYLLQFKSPLEILVDRITALNDPTNIAVKEQFSDMVSEMYDKQDEYADYELTEGMQMQ